MDKLKEYAEVVLRSGINLKEGQCLRIRTTADDYHFARILGQEAYRLGAKYVQTEMMDKHLLAARLENREGESLDFLPDFHVEQHREMLRDDWATIRIDGTAEGDALKNSDPQKVSRNNNAAEVKLDFYSRSLMADEHPWCVIAYPNDSWAEKVLGPGKTEENLWEILKPILRLDKDNPLKAWEEHNASLHARCDSLNLERFDRIRFQSEGTDLTIGLSARSRWCGGPMPLPSGRMFNANIPSEEIYTTPDWRRTDGYVRVTRPVLVLGKQVLGAEFVFEKGRVVKFRADEGGEFLKEFLETDEGAAYLGEIALVQNDSPISNSGMVFHSILFDENASCHMALGAGYPSCLEGFKELDTVEKLKEAGCNDSLVHTDFMIGGPDTKLTGYRADGEEVVLMEKGDFL